MSGARTLAAVAVAATFAASAVRADTLTEPVAGSSAVEPAPVPATAPGPRVQVQRRSGGLVEGERVDGVAGYVTLRLADGSLLSLPPDEVVELRVAVSPPAAPPTVPLVAAAPDAVVTSFESDGNPLLVGLAEPGAALDRHCRMPCDLSVPRGVYDVYIGEHTPTRYVDRLGLDGGELVIVEEDTRPGLKLGGVILAALGIGIGALMIAKRPDHDATPVLASGITSIVVGVGAGVTLLSWPSRRSARVHAR